MHRSSTFSPGTPSDKADREPHGGSGSNLETRPTLIILTGPTGIDKKGVWNSLQNKFKQAHFSKSWTTRSRRPSEDSGTYWFASTERFQAMILQSGFLQVQDVCGYRYGTPIGKLKKTLNEGKLAFLDYCVSGVNNLLPIAKENNWNTVVINLVPPGYLVKSAPDHITKAIAQIEESLISRGITGAELEARLALASDDIQKGEKFEHQVANHDSASTASEICAIVAQALRGVNRFPVAV